jgi:hypothetical protein
VPLIVDADQNDRLWVAFIGGALWFDGQSRRWPFPVGESRRVRRRGHDRGMEMRAEIVINAAADDAWVVVGERFGQISEWASAITGSSMDGLPGVGQVRTCHVAGFGPLGPGVIRERLVDFDPEARSLSYEAAGGMPRFTVHAVNRWWVAPGPGGGCTVKIHATLALRLAACPLGPVLRWRMRADTRQALAELRYRVETGRPHPATATAPAGGKEPA